MGTGKRVNSRSLKVGWSLLGFLLALMVWLYSTGRIYLEGVPVAVLEELAQGRYLVPRAGHFSLTQFVALLPVDPLLAVSVCRGTLLVGAFSLLWLSLARVWANPITPTLTAGLCFLGGQSLWMSAQTLGQATVVFFHALALAALVGGKVPILCGAVLALALTEPASGTAFLLALAYLCYRRQEAYGPLVCALAIVGSGSALLFAFSDFRLQPSLGGLSGWVLVPLLAVRFWPEVREARAGLYLTLLGASVLTGTPELASAICLGDLALTTLKSQGPEDESVSGWRLPLARLAAVTGFVILVVAILPGEQVLNRTLLIPAQKKRLSLGRLFRPFSLSEHSRLLATEPWRQNTPYPSVKAEDIALLGQLGGPFRVLTLGSPAEDRSLSLLYALLANRPLEGWDNSRQLSSSSLVCKEVSQNVVSGLSQVLFRGQDKPRLDRGPEVPPESARVDFRSLMSAPFRVQQVSEESGAAYQLKTLDGQEILSFKDRPAVVVLSAAPQVYRLSSLSKPNESREIVVNVPKLELVRLNDKQEEPSRSLVGLRFKLVNRGATPITSEEIASLWLRSKGSPSYGEFQQQLNQQFILFPEEGLDVTLYLSTPLEEGRYDLEGGFETVDGVKHRFVFKGSETLLTWRRLAPVGTWIEEAPSP